MRHPVRPATRRLTAFALPLALAGGAVTLTTMPAQATEPEAPDDCETRVNDTAEKLLECLTLDDTLEHLQAFQDIADANDGNRASGTSGYDESVAYVVDVLTAAGYAPELQEFDFPFFEELSSSAAVDGEPLTPFDLSTGEGDYSLMAFSPTASVTDAVLVPATDLVVPVADNPPNTSTSGCEPEDFTPAPTDEDAVALVQRGTCSFFQKVLNAQDAGYDGVIIFNEGQEGRDGVISGTLGGDALDTIEIPAIDVGYALGEELALGPEARVSIAAETFGEIRSTVNVLAELPGASDEGVVVMGGHLDSVVEGPGISDNGTGSAALLELAEQVATTTPDRPVRFAWWGAEELGLIGANEYVASLSEAEVAQIGVYLNFDMIASSNFVRFVLDGDESTFPAAVDELPRGTAETADLLAEYYVEQGLPFEDSALNGRSDYQPFLLAGIPSGGLFTGADGIKTEEQAATYGGVAGLPHDVCYHTACDTLVEPNPVPELEQAYGEDVLVGDVNLAVLEENTDAMGAALIRFAFGEGLGLLPQLADDRNPDLSAILECVADNGDGTLTARFGYENRETAEPSEFYIPAGSSDNRLVGPVLETDGPVEDFVQPGVVPGRPGRTPFGEGAFSVTFDADDRIVWVLHGRTATASAGSSRCG